MYFKIIAILGLFVSGLARADLVDTCIRNAQIDGMSADNAHTLCRGKQPGERPLDCYLTSQSAGLGMTERQVARLCNRAPSMKPLWCAQTAKTAVISDDGIAELCRRATDSSPVGCYRSKRTQGYSEQSAVDRCAFD